MDIKTPLGRKSLKDEREAVERFRELHPSFGWMETEKGQPAAMDGFFYAYSQSPIANTYTMSAVVEVKCRKESREHFRTHFDNTWLITHQKLVDGQKISKLCRIPLVGILWTTPDRHLCVVKLTRRDGTYCFDFEVRETETQATINGGRARRANAFIPLQYATEYPSHYTAKTQNEGELNNG